MEYTNDFKDLVKQYHPAYIGMGNPNAKILIIGKETASKLGSEQHHREIELNSKQWKYNIDNSVQPVDVQNWLPELPGTYNPLYPYKGQLFKWMKRVNGKIRGEGGTSLTWSKYQKLLNLILLQEPKELIDFHEYCFITELSDKSALKSRDNDRKVVEESINERLELLRVPFYQNFPIVIVACGHYVRDYDLKLESLFNVSYKNIKEFGIRNWMNIHYRKDGFSPKLLIHTNQLSEGIKDELLHELARECREFISSNNIAL